MRIWGLSNAHHFSVPQQFDITALDCNLQRGKSLEMRNPFFPKLKTGGMLPSLCPTLLNPLSKR